MRRTGGFTLIELMVAVAIIGILTGILVLNMNKPAGKVKTKQEAQSMFSELIRAETQYATENGRYLSTGADETELFPDSPGPQAQDVTVTPSEWDDLHAKPQTGKLYCGYVAVAGTKDDDIPDFAADFGMEQPEAIWYVLYARCDLDNNSTVDAVYFASSVDAQMVSRNDGH